MKLFDELFKPAETHIASYSPFTVQEAYMAIFYSILHADEDWGEKEFKALDAILMRLRVFEDENINFYIAEVKEQYLKYGAIPLINGGLHLISQRLKPQLFCLCAELVLANESITHKEQKILEYLADASNISEELAQKIIEVTLLRMMN
ncbi:tellurite resistance TerB family protein [Limnovirga soli]|jgi:uncharacterized tellurite resistance protein B-like protein|uniref:Co-chaperone DjlA N-terminal domain-containing protein n=1 Tax=Limnovirga soli TaxID=2656915 RepID=A0A8J8JSP8_9BACT|nr:hypothetical protein [Limnovirga soli]NNV54305.1 hypothetical protein [Limnovirga soli]